MTRFILAALVAVFAFPALADGYADQWQVPCTTDANEMRAILAEKYNERRIMSSTSPDASFEIWSNKDTGTWTIMFIHPSGVACAPLSGTDPWVQDRGI